jgi:hypothetical protein
MLFGIAPQSTPQSDEHCQREHPKSGSIVSAALLRLIGQVARSGTLQDKVDVRCRPSILIRQIEPYQTRPRAVANKRYA